DRRRLLAAVLGPGGKFCPPPGSPLGAGPGGGGRGRGGGDGEGGGGLGGRPPRGRALSRRGGGPGEARAASAPPLARGTRGGRSAGEEEAKTERDPTLMRHDSPCRAIRPMRLATGCLRVREKRGREKVTARDYRSLSRRGGRSPCRRRGPCAGLAVKRQGRA